MPTTDTWRTAAGGAALFFGLAFTACSPATAPAAAQPPAPTTAVQPAANAPAPTVPPVAASSPAASAATPTQPAAAAGPAKLNLNTATADQFKTVPNVGDRMVREFNEYRPYASITQFRREIGKYVNTQQVADYEKYVFVPIGPNDADAATLQQIPGVDEAKAGTLIAARPYANNEAFLARLAQIAGEPAVTAARAYLK